MCYLPTSVSGYLNNWYTNHRKMIFFTKINSIFWGFLPRASLVLQTGVGSCCVPTASWWGIRNRDFILHTNKALATEEKCLSSQEKTFTRPLMFMPSILKVWQILGAAFRTVIMFWYGYWGEDTYIFSSISSPASFHAILSLHFSSLFCYCFYLS